jgi:hypothetical protein
VHRAATTSAWNGDTMPFKTARQLLIRRPQSSAAHSNYGWAALEADNFDLALREFSTARELWQRGTMADHVHSIEISWGLALANWWAGNEDAAKQVYVTLASSGGHRYTDVSELKKLPLLWPRTQLARIQAANDKRGQK